MTDQIAESCGQVPNTVKLREGLTDQNADLWERVARAKAAVYIAMPEKVAADVDGIFTDLLAALSSERAARLAAESALDAAEAIVERLPMTADGVRVTGDSRVFDPDTEEWLDCVLDGRDYAYEPGPHYDGDEVRPISECYSTREAALSARDTAESGGGA